MPPRHHRPARAEAAMILIPSASPDETVRVSRTPEGRVELRIGRTASRTAVLTASEAKKVAEALVAAGDDSSTERTS
jgi:hypothetical protein